VAVGRRHNLHLQLERPVELRDGAHRRRVDAQRAGELCRAAVGRAAEQLLLALQPEDGRDLPLGDDGEALRAQGRREALSRELEELGRDLHAAQLRQRELLGHGRGREEQGERERHGSPCLVMIAPRSPTSTRPPSAVAKTP
jgi:hypothetical protein